MAKHLYKKGAKYREEKKFEKRYGKSKGKYVYGATVGKVKRERAKRNPSIKNQTFMCRAFKKH